MLAGRGNLESRGSEDFEVMANSVSMLDPAPHHAALRHNFVLSTTRHRPLLVLFVSRVSLNA